MSLFKIKNLDKTDKKIIEELGKDARTPISTIAKKCNISKQVCSYRINKLENWLIKGFKTKINSAKLGFSTNCIYLKLIDITENEEKKIITNLSDIKEVRWLVSSTGKWDIMVSTSTRTSIEFNKILKKILSEFKGKVLEYETSTILSTINIWLKETPTELEETSTKIIDLDEKDHQIIRTLQQNARTEATNIAKTIGLTAEATINRMKRLKKEGIINSYNLKIDIEKLGLTWYQLQFRLKNLDEEEERKAISRLKIVQGIIYIVRMIGKWNFEVNIYCKDAIELKRRLMDIRNTLSGSIRDYDTNIVLKKHKSKTYFN